MQNLNCCEKSVLVDCWECLQNIFLECEMNGHVSIQLTEDIASLIDSMIHVLETMNHHLINTKDIDNEKEYFETFQCILNIFVLLEEKASSFHFFHSQLTVRLGCLLLYVCFNLLKRKNNNKESHSITNLSLIEPCIQFYPKLLNEISTDLEFKSHEILQSYPFIKDNTETENSLKILLLVSHTSTLHECMSLLWDYTTTIKNVCDIVIEMLNECTKVLSMKEKCHILCSFVLCLPTFRLYHLPSYKPLQFLWNSSFFIPFDQNITHSFVSYCDTTLQYLLSNITASILRHDPLTQQDFIYLIDLLCTLLEEVLYLKIPLTITTKDVFDFYQRALQYDSKSLVIKIRRICSLLLPLVTTCFDEWKEQKELLSLLCQLLEEHLIPHTLSVSCLFTLYTQWTSPFTKMVLFCNTLQDLFETHFSSLIPSIHGPLLVQLLFRAWSSLCYHATHTLSYRLAKQFFHWFLHFSIHFPKGAMKEQTQYLFLLFIWRLLGRTHEKYPHLFNTCLKYFISYALFTTYNTPLHNQQLQHDYVERDIVRANTVCYPSRSQRNLIQIVLLPYLSQHTQLNTFSIFFHTVLKRIHFLLKLLFNQTSINTTQQNSIFLLPNTFNDCWNQCFSLHHLITFLHIPLYLLKQYGTVSHITQAQEYLETFYQDFIALQPTSSYPHDHNDLHQKSITGHWNQTLVHYDIFCFCLDTFAYYPYIITQKIFTYILNYISEILLPRNFTILTTTLVPWIPRLLVSLWSLNNLIKCVPQVYLKHPSLVSRCVHKSLYLLKTLVECHQDTSCSQCTTIISFIVTWFVILTYRSADSQNNICFTWCDKNQLFLLRKGFSELKKDTKMERIVTLFFDCIENNRWEPSLGEEINSLLLECFQEPETIKK